MRGGRCVGVYKAILSKESTVIKQLHAVLIVCDCFRQSGSELEEWAGGLCSAHKREVRTLNN
jgi:hypothetical protein